MIRSYAISLVALSLLAVPVHAGGTYTDSYTIPTSWPIGLSCTPDCIAPGLNIGGTNFAPDSSTPTHVTVSDASGGDVAFTVCQDFNGDGFCGDDGTFGPAEPSIVVCGTEADLTTSAVGFSGFFQTSVFVTAFEPDCPGVATTGTVTLTTA